MDHLSVGLAIANKDLLESVRTCLSGMPLRLAFEENEIDDWSFFLERLERMRPNVLLVDMSLFPDAIEEGVYKIKNSPAEPIVVALHAAPDADVIVAALRGGAHEFLYPPLQESLPKAFERISSERRKRQNVLATGKVISVLSAKGGSGGTTVACHLSVELARRTGKKILLSDLDLDGGMIRFLMKSKMPYSVLDAVNNLHRLDHSYWAGLVSNGIPGLEVLATPLTLPTKRQPGPTEIRSVLNFMKSEYDISVVDLGSRLTLLVLNALASSDFTYLITTLDIPALHQAKLVTKSLLESGYPKESLRLVLNRTPKHMEVTTDELERMLGASIFAMLPNDYTALHESYSEGQLLSDKTQLGKHLARFAAKVSGIEQEEKRKFSFFG